MSGLPSVKRSRSVRRLLLDGLSAGAIAVSAGAAEPRVTPESHYTNDYHIPGAGYYHAPFNAFFPQPYNHYDATRRMYYFGGQWASEPHRSIVNISAPTADAARQAETMRTDLRSSTVSRSGFGSTGSGSSIRS